MRLNNDLYLVVQQYLGLLDQLYWSSISKEYTFKINRALIKKHISAIFITHYLEWSFSDEFSAPSFKNFNRDLVAPIHTKIDKETLSHEIICFMEPCRSFWPIRVFGDELLKSYNIHTYPFWFRYRRCYRVPKMILSYDIWDGTPRVLKNQNMCAVYRCRKMGSLRRKITNSLILKALVN